MTRKVSRMMKLEQWGNSLKEKIRGKAVYRVTLESEIMCQEWGAYHQKNPSVLSLPKDRSCRHLLFFPKKAPVVVEDKERVIVTRKGPGFDAVPVVFVMQCEESVEFLFDLLPLNLNNSFPVSYSATDRTCPVWDYGSPFSYFTYLPLLKIWDVPHLGMSTDFPFAELGGLHVPVGNFFRLRGSAWLIASGSGDLKFVKGMSEFRFINRTAEKAVFKWVVPQNWQDRVYWKVGGKKTGGAEVQPNGVDIPVTVHIDREVRERDRFLPTLVVAQSRSRVEWFPLPLFPE